MDEMTTEQWRAFLGEGRRTGKLATTTADGSPTVNPVWFVLDGDDIVFTTGGTSAKAGHLRREPHAALCVDDEAYPYAYVLVRGRVRWDPDDPQQRAITRRITERYVDPELVDGLTDRNAVPGEWICRLRCERVLALLGVAD